MKAELEPVYAHAGRRFIPLPPEAVLGKRLLWASHGSLCSFFAMFLKFNILVLFASSNFNGAEPAPISY